MKSKCFLLSILLILALAVPVYAQEVTPPDQPGEEVWTNSEIEVHPELGPLDPDQTPGVNGYKVFYPGAIKKVTITQRGQKSEENGPVSPQSLLTEERTGYTDAFSGYFEWGQAWHWNASHTSESELNETQIWVDGVIKLRGDTGWRDSCPNHTNGFIAPCNTETIGPTHWPLWSSYAQSTHFFHTSPYVDSNFTTGDYGY